MGRDTVLSSEELSFMDQNNRRHGADQPKRTRAMHTKGKRKAAKPVEVLPADLEEDEEEAGRFGYAEECAPSISQILSASGNLGISGAGTDHALTADELAFLQDYYNRTKPAPQSKPKPKRARGKKKAAAEEQQCHLGQGFVPPSRSKESRTVVTTPDNKGTLNGKEAQEEGNLTTADEAEDATRRARTRVSEYRRKQQLEDPVLRSVLGSRHQDHLSMRQALKELEQPPVPVADPANKLPHKRRPSSAAASRRPSSWSRRHSAGSRRPSMPDMGKELDGNVVANVDRTEVLESWSQHQSLEPENEQLDAATVDWDCLLYTSPSPRDS
eukprot:TRINITY_DN30031_c0_g1_i1.p1 TRINITY_DN30031_c0_g1~~TRINITY_DN30031_c0_g1_i1.p1  ORF type:complete len:328 (-),score=66.14 TRINITY_DN30031_c0_g1_i1:130-1113(-)